MLDRLNQSLEYILNMSWQNRSFLLLIAAILLTSYIVTLLSGGRLLYLGIVPRRVLGLRGILFAPFLHANFNHLFFNSIPLLVFSNFLLIEGLDYFVQLSILLIVSSGFLTWLIGKPGLHIGASSVITGYWIVLVCNILQHATLTAVILGVISLYYFAGIFFGIFPSQKSVSWEGHLSGFVCGLAINYFFTLPIPLPSLTFLY
ncbi:MAG: rhomboid family intramembrane serine protease [Legionellaceae bacterium]|nr:rhomboid family intramembrane serine protease [Legionellaceae bacterium]